MCFTVVGLCTNFMNGVEQQPRHPHQSRVVAVRVNAFQTSDASSLGIHKQSLNISNKHSH
jgi:hypothetical protein